LELKQKVPLVQSKSQEGSTYLAVCIQKLESSDLTENEQEVRRKGVCILEEGF